MKPQRSSLTDKKTGEQIDVDLVDRFLFRGKLYFTYLPHDEDEVIIHYVHPWKIFFDIEYDSTVDGKLYEEIFVFFKLRNSKRYYFVD